VTMRAQTGDMEEISTFGQWVKHQRNALGLTQANLAQKVACSKSTINKIESDLRCPSKSMIELLAINLKIPRTDLAAFFHLARPNLLIELDEFSNRDGLNAAKARPMPIKNLPVPLTPLIGRGREVAEVCSYLQKAGTRLLTLTGPGGTGKTRLALQVAADLQDKFADGVYFVSLAPVRDPALVLSTIVQALGLKSMRDQRDDELLVTHLHEKAALLILDNFEQTLPAAKAIAELLTLTAYIKVLVTSRAVLRLTGEQEFVVPPLDVPDLNQATDLATLALSPAVVLFVQHAQAVRADFALNAENAQSVAEICARLDGLPLAIELAAARCKVLSPQAILARLKGATGGVLGLLSGGSQDLPARQQTIRQTIEWSYNLLNEREQALFRCLGVFVGGCTLDAIEDVCAKLKTESAPRLRPAPHVSALDSAIALMDQSLLRQLEDPDGEPRFIIPETLREYALECLATCNELETMRRRHATYLLQMVEMIEPKLRGAEQQACLKRLDVEYNNIRSALTWSCVSDAEMALRFGGALWEYWLTRGYLSEGRAWLTDILQHPAAASPRQARARAQALNGAGLLTSVQGGDQELAGVYLREALFLFRELNDRMGEAWALNHLGQTLNLSGQREQALHAFDASLQLFRALDANWHSAWVLINLGEVSLHNRETDRARQFLSESRDLFSALSDKRGMAAAIDRLGRLALMRHDSSQATTLFLESLKLFEEIGDREGCGWTFHHLGRMAHDAGLKKQAAEYLIESLRLFDKLNDKWGCAWSLLHLAKVVNGMHEHESAAVLFGAADAMMTAFNDRMSASEREYIDQSFAEARPQFDLVTWARGRALSIEKVLALVQGLPFLVT